MKSFFKLYWGLICEVWVAAKMDPTFPIRAIWWRIGDRLVDVLKWEDMRESPPKLINWAEGETFECLKDD